MNKTMQSLAVLFISLLMPQLVFSQSWQETKTAELVDKARANTKQVSIEELKKVIDDDADVLVFDVRTTKEYEAAHIPGAYHIDRGLLEFAVWSVAEDLNEKIYVYCRTGARAALASERLQELGYTKVHSVATGAIDWTKAGYPIQTSILDERVMITPVPDE